MDLEPAVRAAGVLRADCPVVVLYSGGRDSTCLLDVAVRIAGPRAVTALHVNYGLREAAAADEEHCARTCAELEVALEVRVAAAPGPGNLQAWARELRYAAARELAEDAGAEVAAGHTASDQVETILYRLASSPSRRALLGMRAREGRLVRPLLSVTRADTRAHCEARGLPWREDTTNAGDAFARGRVRHGLLPALEAIHPAAADNVLAVAAILREEGAVLDELVEEILCGRSAVPLSTLRSLAPALRRLVVQRLADEAAGGPAAGVGRRADEVAAMSGAGTHALDLPGGIRAVARRGVVTFTRPAVPRQRLSELPR